MVEEVEKKIELSKLSVLRKLPLMAPIIAEVRIVKDNNILTMASSFKEKRIYYNEEFVKNISNETAICVLMHEYMHYLLIHDLTQLRTRQDRYLMNIITDSIINYLVSKIMDNHYRFIDEIGGVTFEFIRNIVEEFRNKSDEELAREDSIYLFLKVREKLKQFAEDLEKELNKNGEGEENEDNEGEGEGGESNEEKDSIDRKIEKVIEKHFKNINEGTKEGLKKAIKEALELDKEINENREAIEKLKEEIKRVWERGKMLSKDRGNELLGISEIIDLILNRKRRNWRQILREMTSEIRSLISDYDYTRPSRKTKIIEDVFNTKTFIPDLEKEDIDINVVIGIDVSGSISDNEYKEFVNEVYNLLSDIREVKGYIVMWEADITKIIKIRNGWNKEILEELRERKGYGGTVIESFFKKSNELVKNKKRNTYIVVLTDGETEKVEREWVKGWRKVIFIISKNGSKESLREVEKERNVYMAFMD